MNAAHTLDDTLTRLREGKRQLRKTRVNMSLAEKVRQVVELQSVVLPTIRRRRALRGWEFVWPLYHR
jgi:hypothetical protein